MAPVPASALGRRALRPARGWAVVSWVRAGAGEVGSREPADPGAGASDTRRRRRPGLPGRHRRWSGPGQPDGSSGTAQTPAPRAVARAAIRVRLPGGRNVVLEPFAQDREDPRQRAGHLHLADPEPGADLLLGHVVVEAQAEDEPLALGERRQRAAQRRARLDMVEVVT